jgi:DNA-directed RNA polymerase specialized sigma subunit
MQRDDLKIIEEFKKGNKKPLEDLMKGSVNYYVNRYKSQGSPLALEAKAWRIIYENVDKYNPSTGANLKTFLSNQLQQLSREAQNMQFMYIPERDAQMATQFTSAINELRIELNRNPTDMEIADYLKIPVSQVQKMKRVTAGTMMQGSQVFDGNVIRYDLDESRMLDIYNSLNDTAKKVFEYKFGYNQIQIENTSEIAQRLGISPAAVSQHLKTIENKIRGIIL